jgi:hypothetical protein
MAKFKEVRKVLIDRDLTYRDLARMTGFSAGRISDAINGRKVARKVKCCIALALRKDFSELWDKADLAENPRERSLNSGA